MFTDNVETYHSELLDLRRARKMNKFVSLCWNRIDNQYIIFTDDEEYEDDMIVAPTDTPHRVGADELGIPADIQQIKNSKKLLIILFVYL